MATPIPEPKPERNWADLAAKARLDSPAPEIDVRWSVRQRIEHESATDAVPAMAWWEEVQSLLRWRSVQAGMAAAVLFLGFIGASLHDMILEMEMYGELQSVLLLNF